MEENEKKETLELFDKMLDLKFELNDLIAETDELIERCNTATNNV